MPMERTPSPNVEDSIHSIHRTQSQIIFICTQKCPPNPYRERNTLTAQGRRPTNPTQIWGPPPHRRKGSPHHTENTSHSPKPTEEPLALIQKRGPHLHPGRAVLKVTWFRLRHVSRPGSWAPQTAACPSAPWGEQVGPQGEPFKKSRDSQEAVGGISLVSPPSLLPHIQRGVF